MELLIQRFATVTIDEEAQENGVVTGQGATPTTNYTISTTTQEAGASIDVSNLEDFEGIDETTVTVTTENEDGEEEEITVTLSVDSDGNITVSDPEDFDISLLDGVVIQVAAGQGQTVDVTFSTNSAVALMNGEEPVADGTYTFTGTQEDEDGEEQEATFSVVVSGGVITSVTVNDGEAITTAEEITTALEGAELTSTPYTGEGETQETDAGDNVWSGNVTLFNNDYTVEYTDDENYTVMKGSENVSAGDTLTSSVNWTVSADGLRNGSLSADTEGVEAISVTSSDTASTTTIDGTTYEISGTTLVGTSDNTVVVAGTTFTYTIGDSSVSLVAAGETINLGEGTISDTSSAVVKVGDYEATYNDGALTSLTKGEETITVTDGTFSDSGVTYTLTALESDGVVAGATISYEVSVDSTTSFVSTGIETSYTFDDNGTTFTESGNGWTVNGSEATKVVAAVLDSSTKATYVAPTSTVDALINATDTYTATLSIDGSEVKVAIANGALSSETVTVNDITYTLTLDTDTDVVTATGKIAGAGATETATGFTTTGADTTDVVVVMSETSAIELGGVLYEVDSATSVFTGYSIEGTGTDTKKVAISGLSSDSHTLVVGSTSYLYSDTSISDPTSGSISFKVSDTTLNFTYSNGTFSNASSEVGNYTVTVSDTAMADGVVYASEITVTSTYAGGAIASSDVSVSANTSSKLVTYKYADDKYYAFLMGSSAPEAANGTEAIDDQQLSVNFSSGDVVAFSTNGTNWALVDDASISSAGVITFGSSADSVAAAVTSITATQSGSQITIKPGAEQSYDGDIAVDFSLQMTTGSTTSYTGASLEASRGAVGAAQYLSGTNEAGLTFTGAAFGTGVSTEYNNQPYGITISNIKGYDADGQAFTSSTANTEKALYWAGDISVTAGSGNTISFGTNVNLSALLSQSDSTSYALGENGVLLMKVGESWYPAGATLNTSNGSSYTLSTSSAMAYTGAILDYTDNKLSFQTSVAGTSANDVGITWNFKSGEASKIEVAVGGSDTTLWTAEVGSANTDNLNGLANVVSALSEVGGGTTASDTTTNFSGSSIDLSTATTTDDGVKSNTLNGIQYYRVDFTGKSTGTETSWKETAATGSDGAAIGQIYEYNASDTVEFGNSGTPSGDVKSVSVALDANGNPYVKVEAGWGAVTGNDNNSGTTRYGAWLDIMDTGYNYNAAASSKWMDTANATTIGTLDGQSKSSDTATNDVSTWSISTDTDLTKTSNESTINNKQYAYWGFTSETTTANETGLTGKSKWRAVVWGSTKDGTPTAAGNYSIKVGDTYYVVGIDTDTTDGLKVVGIGSGEAGDTISNYSTGTTTISGYNLVFADTSGDKKIGYSDTLVALPTWAGTSSETALAYANGTLQMMTGVEIGGNKYAIAFDTDTGKIMAAGSETGTSYANIGSSAFDSSTGTLTISGMNYTGTNDLNNDGTTGDYGLKATAGTGAKSLIYNISAGDVKSVQVNVNADGNVTGIIFYGAEDGKGTVITDSSYTSNVAVGGVWSSYSSISVNASSTGKTASDINTAIGGIFTNTFGSNGATTASLTFGEEVSSAKQGRLTVGDITSEMIDGITFTNAIEGLTTESKLIKATIAGDTYYIATDEKATSLTVYDSTGAESTKLTKGTGNSMTLVINGTNYTLKLGTTSAGVVTGDIEFDSPVNTTITFTTTDNATSGLSAGTVTSVSGLYAVSEILINDATLSYTNNGGVDSTTLKANTFADYSEFANWWLGSGDSLTKNTMAEAAGSTYASMQTTAGAKEAYAYFLKLATATGDSYKVDGGSGYTGQMTIEGAMASDGTTENLVLSYTYNDSVLAITSDTSELFSFDGSTIKSGDVTYTLTATNESTITISEATATVSGMISDADITATASSTAAVITTVAEVTDTTVVAGEAGVSFSDATTGLTFTVTSDTTGAVTLTYDSGTVVSGATLTISDTTYTATFIDDGNGSIDAGDKIELVTAAGTVDTSYTATAILDSVTPEPTPEAFTGYRGEIKIGDETFYVATTSTSTTEEVTLYTDNTYSTETANTSAYNFSFIDEDSIAGNDNEYFGWIAKEASGTTITLTGVESTTETGTVNGLTVTKVNGVYTDLNPDDNIVITANSITDSATGVTYTATAADSDTFAYLASVQSDITSVEATTVLTRVVSDVTVAGASLTVYESGTSTADLTIYNIEGADSYTGDSIVIGGTTYAITNGSVKLDDITSESIIVAGTTAYTFTNPVTGETVTYYIDGENIVDGSGNAAAATITSETSTIYTFSFSENGDVIQITATESGTGATQSDDLSTTAVRTTSVIDSEEPMRVDDPSVTDATQGFALIQEGDEDFPQFIGKYVHDAEGENEHKIYVYDPENPDVVTVYDYEEEVTYTVETEEGHVSITREDGEDFDEEATYTMTVTFGEGGGEDSGEDSGDDSGEDEGDEEEISLDEEEYVENEDGTVTFTGTKAQIEAELNEYLEANNLTADNIESVEFMSAGETQEATITYSEGGEVTTLADGDGNETEITDGAAELSGRTFTFNDDGTVTVSEEGVDDQTIEIVDNAFTVEGQALEDATLASRDEETGAWNITDPTIDNVVNDTGEDIEVTGRLGEGTLGAGDALTADGVVDNGDKVGSAIKKTDEDGNTDLLTSNGTFENVNPDAEVSYDSDTGAMSVSGLNGDSTFNGNPALVAGDDDFGGVVETDGTVSALTGISDGASVAAGAAGKALEVEDGASVTFEAPEDGATYNVNGEEIFAANDSDGVVAKIADDGTLDGVSGVSDGASVAADAPVQLDAGEVAAAVNGQTYDVNDPVGATVDDGVLGVSDGATVNSVPEDATIAADGTVALPNAGSYNVNGDEVAFSGDEDGIVVSASPEEGITGISGVSDGANVTAPNGTPVATDALGSDTTAAITLNDTPVTVSGDEDGVTFTPTEEGLVVSGLDDGAMLGGEGTVIVDGEAIELSSDTSVKGGVGVYTADDQTFDDELAENGIKLEDVITDTSSLVDEETGAIDLSDRTDPVAIRLTDSYNGEDITLPKVGGSVIQIDSNVADGQTVNVDGSGSDKGNTFRNNNPNAKMNATGGSGDDIFTTASNDDTVDVSNGGDDEISGNGGKVAGLGANSEASFKFAVEDQADLLAHIKNGNPSFTQSGEFSVNNGAGTFDLLEQDGAEGTFANFKTQDGEKVKYGWAGEAENLDASAVEGPAVLLGNVTGEGNGANITGTSEADSILAGAGDNVNVDPAGGNDQIDMQHSDNDEEGATLTFGTAAADTSNGSATVTVNDYQTGFDGAANGLAVPGDAKGKVNGQRPFSFGKRSGGGFGFIFGAITAVFNALTGRGYAEKADDEIAVTADGTSSSSATVASTGTAGEDYFETKITNADGTTDNVVMIDEDITYAVNAEASLRPDNFYGNDGAAVHFGNVSDSIVADLNNENGDFYFDGISELTGGAGKSTLVGSNEAASKLNAGTGETSLMGGLGQADELSGSSASDKDQSTFFYGAGEGADSIKSFDFGSGEDNDKVDLDYMSSLEGSANLTSAGFDESGNLLIQVGEAEGDTLTIENAKNNIIQATANGKEWVVEFGDNLTYDKNVNMYGDATSDSVNVMNISGSDSVQVYMNGEAFMENGAYGERFDGNYYYGVRVLDATAASGNVSLVGSDNVDDTITGGTGANSLWGGMGGNDVINAGSGTNEIFYEVGDGEDTINGVKEGDVINLWNVNLSDIDLAATAENSTTSQIAVKFNDGGSLTINGTTTAVDFKVGGETWRMDRETLEGGAHTWSKKA